MKEPVLISACLLGVKCRYDGDKKAVKLLHDAPRILPIPICPEQLGGLPTPRPASNLIGGDGRDVIDGKARLVNDSGVDVTENFIRGGKEACLLARITGAKRAILKDKSPSCGTTMVKISGRWTNGVGVAAAMLEDMGIEIENEYGYKIMRGQDEKGV